MITLCVTDIEGIEHRFEVSEDNQESILDIAEKH